MLNCVIEPVKDKLQINTELNDAASLLVKGATLFSSLFR